MLSEIMERWYGQDGKPDFEKMKQFMKHRGKEAFRDEELQMMKQHCAGEKVPDPERTKQMMEEHGCSLG